MPLATLERAQPNWKLSDIWYPGYVTVRARSATRQSNSARLSMESSPVGRQTIVAQAAGVTWDRQGANLTTTSRGDTAMVEIAFDASANQTYTFTLMASVATSAEAARPRSGPRAISMPP